MTNHLHDSFESAYAAVRRGIAERDAKRREEEGARQLLVEDEEMPEAPPRTGDQGRDRRGYDAKRHHWRQELLHKVDECDVVEPPRDQVLHDAVAALRADDAEKFNRLVTLAIARRVNDEVADRKLAIAMQMFQSGEDEGDEED